MGNNEGLATESFEGPAYQFLQPHCLEPNHQLLSIPWEKQKLNKIKSTFIYY